MVSLRRGSSLIAVLMLITLLFILGIGLLMQKSTQYDESTRQLEAAQARQLAQAGLVDCGLKLAKDRTFPPILGNGNAQFSYSEEVTNLDGVAVGSYTVNVNATLNESPYWIIQVKSEGWLGERDHPRGRYLIYAEMDMSAKLRTNSSLDNPDFHHWVHYADQEFSEPPPL